MTMATPAFVVRGFIPDGVRSTPKTGRPDESEKTGFSFGAAAQPIGINPLTTGISFTGDQCHQGSVSLGISVTKGSATGLVPAFIE